MITPTSMPAMPQNMEATTPALTTASAYFCFSSSGVRPTYIHMYQTPITAMQVPNVQAWMTMSGSGERAASTSEAARPRNIVNGTKK